MMVFSPLRSVWSNIKVGPSLPIAAVLKPWWRAVNRTLSSSTKLPEKCASISPRIGSFSMNGVTLPAAVGPESRCRSCC